MRLLEALIETYRQSYLTIVREGLKLKLARESAFGESFLRTGFTRGNLQGESTSIKDINSHLGNIAPDD